MNSLKKAPLTYLLALILLSTGILPTVKAQSIPGNFCISKEEYNLYKLINDFRIKNDLPAIPISSSLSYVAKLHVRDLHDNGPDTSNCNLNSWSDKGPWTSCCHSNITPQPDCILNKPRELTKYTGDGHELGYWDSEGANPDTIYEFWVSVEQAIDLITNREKWRLYSWKAMGVGIYEGYASVWIGEKVDGEAEPRICSSDVIPQVEIPAEDKDNTVMTSPVERFFLIFGSFDDIEKARKERDHFVEEGFYQAKILIRNNNFRVSLSDHATMEEAQEARKRIPKEYQEAWIFKF